MTKTLLSLFTVIDAKELKKKMMGMMKRQTSARWWWSESHQTPGRSPWLQSTLAELDQKTEAMLQLIEEDADSFALRAEMYYKKRPQLISMVEDFYRAHRSLAEKYDQVKSDSGTRLVTTLGTSFSSTKSRLEKSMSGVDRTYDSFSEVCDHEESAESEVDDPEQDDVNLVEEDTKDEEALSEVNDEETREEDVLSEVIDEETKDEEIISEVGSDEVMKLKEELRRLEEENRIQKDQLEQKDEEKREAIRQLSLAVDMLKEENAKLRKCITRDSPKKSSPSELKSELKETFLRKLFNRSQRNYRIAGCCTLAR
ncbi:protein NETWORKED 3A isoform X1 [Ziziphus jujuba]|uniref:Protein NETWORKED 3A isoform X1 n=2 Tax=Ziziphus jujuba TaxID=326968 RepID=A0ABM4AIC4_ZIZJJ|nr:protein NETWORKED 3A isoform X1 [Ziziphus jujuba]